MDCDLKGGNSCEVEFFLAMLPKSTTYSFVGTLDIVFGEVDR